MSSFGFVLLLSMLAGLNFWFITVPFSILDPFNLGAGIFATITALRIALRDD